MAVNVYGLDDTLAATRAVFNAIHHGRLGYARLVGVTAVEFVERGSGPPRQKALRAPWRMPSDGVVAPEVRDVEGIAPGDALGL